MNHFIKLEHQLFVRSSRETDVALTGVETQIQDCQNKSIHWKPVFPVQFHL